MLKGAKNALKKQLWQNFLKYEWGIATKSSTRIIFSSQNTADEKQLSRVECTAPPFQCSPSLVISKAAHTRKSSHYCTFAGVWCAFRLSIWLFSAALVTIY